MFSDSATQAVEPAVRAQLDYATRTVTRLSETMQGLRDTEAVLLEKRGEVGGWVVHPLVELVRRLPCRSLTTSLAAPPPHTHAHTHAHTPFIRARTLSA